MPKRLASKNMQNVSGAASGRFSLDTGRRILSRILTKFAAESIRTYFGSFICFFICKSFILSTSFYLILSG